MPPNHRCAVLVGTAYRAQLLAHTPGNLGGTVSTNKEAALDAVNVALVSQITTDVGLREGIVLAALLFLAKFDYVKLSGLEPN